MSQLNRTGSCAVAVDTGAGVTPMKRVAVACLVGTTIEAYDFIILAPQQLWCFPRCSFRT
jgi:hypothetical protein